MSVTETLEAQQAALEAEIRALPGNAEPSGQGQEEPVAEVQNVIAIPEAEPETIVTEIEESMESILGLPEQDALPESNTSENANGNVPLSTYELLEQQNKSLQGQFAHLNKQNSEMKSELDQMKGRMSATEEAKQTTPDPTPAPREPNKVKDIYTEQDVEEHGTDFLETTMKAANHVGNENRDYIDGKLAEIRAAQDAMNKQTEKTSEQAQIDSFWREIESLVPQGRAVYQSEKFQSWARNIIPNYPGGATYRQVMDLAADQNSAKGVADILSSFVQSIKATQAGNDQKTISQVEPNTSAGAPVTSSQFAPGKRIFSRAEADDIMLKLEAGHFGDKTDKIADGLKLAWTEGRVR